MNQRTISRFGVSRGHTWINWRLCLSELLPQLFR